MCADVPLRDFLDQRFSDLEKLVRAEISRLRPPAGKQATLVRLEKRLRLPDHLSGELDLDDVGIKARNAELASRSRSGRTDA